MTPADAITEAIKHLDAAEAAMRLVKLQTTAITVHWVDVARLHAKATVADLKRAEVAND